MSSCTCCSDVCTCCVGDREATPLSLEQRPALPALRYRVGTYSDFLQSMLAGIGRSPDLKSLTTRDPSDFTIGLADAWACTLDVLTFYQERIANEGYLRSAVERRSVLELAAETGYRLDPGVAASTNLAFFLETAPGTPLSTTVPVATKVQSLPGPGEVPQIFETVAQITAWQAWNAVMARQTEPVVFQKGTTECYLAGVTTNLNPGDYLLLVGHKQDQDPSLAAENWDFRKLLTVQKDPLGKFTRVTWEKGLGKLGWVPPYGGIAIFALRTRAQLFGYNAPDWTAMPAAVTGPYLTRYNVQSATEWPGMSLAKVGTDKDHSNPPAVVFLDSLYPQFVAKSWVVVSRPAPTGGKGSVELYQVTEAADDSRTDFGFSAKTTRLTLKGENLASFNAFLRQTVVFGQSELLPQAERPIAAAVHSNPVTLAVNVAGVKAGMPAMVSETRSGEIYPFQQEIAWIKIVDSSSGLTTLTFDPPLRNTYSREGIRFNFNVAPATHGESRQEVLGSGNGSYPNQAFLLKQKPLTYVSSNSPQGSSSTLTVRVDGVAWTEVPSLYAQPPDARVYTTSIADSRDVTVQIGDGVEGARLPTGIENLSASYRSGIGLAGEVKSGQLSLLMNRPLGVKAVTNPEAPTGAADPESIDSARANAPLQVLTFDRIVSVVDYERYARAFPGMAKARADLLWDGENRLVYVTVALAGDAAFDPASDIAKGLKSNLSLYGNPYFSSRLEGYRKRAFRGSARIKVDPARVFGDVRKACLNTLAAEYSFEAATLARSISLAAIFAVLQAVPGVVGAEVDKLEFDSGAAPTTRADRLDAQPAHWDGAVIQPAELLVLVPGGFAITELT
jgi:hypothetical protein